MEADRFDDAVRAIVGTPSRRALSRALAALAVGSLLSPLLRVSDAEGKKGHGNHKLHRHKAKKRKKRKKKISSQCAANQEFCSAGEYSQCCSTAKPCENCDPVEVCTDCGCCPFDNSQCCPSAGDGLCCRSGSQCSYSADFKYSACCEPDDKVCFGGCCDANDVCCTMTDGTPYCCSGEDGLTCKKSGGPTCVKA